MLTPTLDEVKTIAQGGDYRRIPVCRELYADSITPVAVMRILKNYSHHCFILESVEDAKKWGRYTFLGFDPLLELTCQNGTLTVKSGTTITEQTTHPGEAIRRILRENKSPQIEGMPSFTGGLVGYFSYDYIKYSEPTLNLDAEDNESFKDVDLMLFDKVIAFDNLRQKIVLIAGVRTEAPDTEYHKAEMELESLAHLITTGDSAAIPPLKLKTPFTPLFDKPSFCEMVEQGKRHIREGDIFQVVLSNRLEADMEGSLFDVYRVLRTTNPSPYMFYFSSDDVEIAGASPETLAKLENGVLHTFPLAGTRPRGKPRNRTKRWSKSCCTTKKSWRNTICWWILVATTSAKSAKSVRSR